jgi:GT2 family glycosyltransferase
MTTMRPLTVVLVNYRSLANIEARLASPALRGAVVIVVDNGDDPDGVSALCTRYGATPLLLARNVGFAAGVNAAVASVAEPDRPWLLLNPDAAIMRDDLEALVEDLPGRDGVGPALVQPDGRLQVGAGGGPLTLRSVAYYFLFLVHLLPRLRGIFLTRRQTRASRDVDWLCMACLVLTADAFDRFGPIPEDELVYAEDVAWGTRASRSGAKFRLRADIVVRHEHGSSGASNKWVGAVERLCRRRLGGLRGGLAIVAIRLGLGMRRLLGRRVA